MTDQLERIALDLRELASDDVPVELDHRRILDEGGRRVRRRRVAAVAAVVAVTATVSVGATVWSGTGDAPSDGGPTRGVDAAARPTATPTRPSTPSTSTTPTPAVPRLEPGTDLTDAVVELVPRLSEARLGGMTGSAPFGGREEVQADLGLRGRTGYLGVVVQPTVDPDLCTTVLRPHEAQGRACAEASDDRGRWARITWTDSRQGPVAAVRVVDGDREVVVATAAGVPPYSPYVDGETDPDELPWGSHSQDDAGNVLPPDPPLDQQPLDDDALLKMARALLTLDG